MAVGSNKSWSSLSLSLSLGLLLLVVGKRKSREGWLRLSPRYISVIKAIEIETNGPGSFLHIHAAGSPSYVISPHPHPVCVCAAAAREDEEDGERRRAPSSSLHLSLGVSESPVSFSFRDPRSCPRSARTSCDLGFSRHIMAKGQKRAEKVAKLLFDSHKKRHSG